MQLRLLIHLQKNKLKMKKHYIFLLLLITTVLFSCEDSKETFDNKVFLNASSKVTETIMKGETGDIEKVIQSSLANPEIIDIKVNYNISSSMVNVYNKAYSDNATMLPAENYELTKTNVSIFAGSTLSEESSLIFKDLGDLDRETVYVLPISIASANIEILKSASTLYYIFKAGALINVVADIAENYLLVDWKNPGVVNNLSQVTMEALIRARDFDRQISTVMGIEGTFLIRLGDAGFPSNQIQIATSRGNFPSGDSQKGLPTNEFTHIALTYNSAESKMILYVNGKVQGESTKNLGSVNLGRGGVDGFSIGRSYADERYLAGDISEVRIWNVVRTQDEIANNPYSVSPDSEGLVTYWKFDDEDSKTIKDYTGNNNNAIANKPLKWNKVTLPEPKK